MKTIVHLPITHVAEQLEHLSIVGQMNDALEVDRIYKRLKNHGVEYWAGGYDVCYHFHFYYRYREELRG